MKIKNCITLTLIRFFDQTKILDLVKFVFLDLDKVDSKLLSTILLTLASISIGIDLIVFNIEISDVNLLLKLWIK